MAVLDTYKGEKALSPLDPQGVSGYGWQENINVYMGELVELDAASNDLKIAFGNCCPKDIGFDMRIKGCPPYPFALRDRLKASQV